MSKPIALIDCDEVLVEAAIDWVAHLNKLAGTDYTVSELGGDYNLGRIFKERHGIENPMDFWFCDNLYDDRFPKAGAINAMAEFAINDIDVYIVTYCVGNHFMSKVNFLERWFGGLFKDIIATKSKHMIKGDLIIDDRDDNLVHCAPDMIKVRMKTPYKQVVDFRPDFILNGWDDETLTHIFDTIVR
jgi:5'(3')-deoxyribonucleotidase